MVDQFGRIFSLIIMGGVAIRIVTNKNTAATLGAAFNGIGADISAAFGK